LKNRAPGVSREYNIAETLCLFSEQQYLPAHIFFHLSDDAVNTIKSIFPYVHTF